jgi:hypothetical protein
VHRSEIKINGVYGRYTGLNRMRTVRAIVPGVNGTTDVLYTLEGGKSWEKEYKTCLLATFQGWAEYLDRVEDNSHWQFLADCREVVRRFGNSAIEDDFQINRAALRAQIGGGLPNAYEADVYVDDRIVIAVSATCGSMCVVRKAVDDPNEPHLALENPVIYVDRAGKPYRFHGEHNVLIPHVAELLNGRSD